ncbi:MAG TPA: S-methyl-5-thioribose-1-phosphate isomerase [Candidatus Aveggerthella excrementigallinarum]|nr:S-methyl-5-thioribose-1-phosphate isomerase [Candidatus Aveggerthella excrementigallinarum]
MGVEALPRTIEWVPLDGADGVGGAMVRLVEQRALPARLEFWGVRSLDELIEAIQCLAVRGAPALGLAGAYGVCLAGVIALRDACSGGEAAASSLVAALEPQARRLAAARPTAVNLVWGVRQVMKVLRTASHRGDTARAALRAAIARAEGLAREDEEANRAIGAHGAALLPQGARVLTHCNAGSLACGFYGTALGVVYAAFEQGKLAHVYADETRPVGQGARLTMWELSRAGVPCTLQCDNMAASLMAAGQVDAVVVGADRIAANGDVANKVGTYPLAIAAAYHGVPFYVAAPTSTIDASLADGAGIPIEHRDAREVIDVDGFAPDVFNPAFDVTPAALIAGVVTERGVFQPAEVVRALEGR